MVQRGAIHEKAVVSLDASKLFGVRQVWQVSARWSGGASNAEMGKVLSKIGEPPPAPAQLARLLSKIGAEVPTAPAQLARLLSKIGEAEGKV